MNIEPDWSRHLTPEEQSLVDWAKENFGESLLEFLLAGYAREESDPFPAFLVESSQALVESRYIITFENQVDGGLPVRKQPIILVGFLQMIIDLEHDEHGGIPFPAFQLFDLLRWPESPANFERVDNAVANYFNMAVTVTQDLRGLHLEEPTDGRVSTYRYLTSYQSNVGSDGKIDLEEYTYLTIVFSREAVSELRQKKMFGIDWTRVKSIKAGKFSDFWKIQ